MPATVDVPRELEPGWLQHSLDRYLALGLVLMVALIAGFAVYEVREPGIRSRALRQQHATYVRLGTQLFANNCSACHGTNGSGGTAPRLNAKQFLAPLSDEQIRLLVTGGIAGTAMPAWGIDFGGTLTDEQIRQIIAYLRSWEPTAPSVPNWRQGAGP